MLPFRNFDTLLKNIVVSAARDGGIERIRQRKDVQQGRPILVDAIDGDFIAGEWLSSRWIDYRGPRAATSVRIVSDARLREISIALALGRNSHPAKVLRGPRSRVLEGVEEKELLLKLVGRFRDPDRSSECESESVVTSDRPRSFFRTVRVAPLQIVEKIVGVQHLVAFVPVPASVVLASPGLGDDVDARAQIAGVFRLISVEQ